MHLSGRRPRRWRGQVLYDGGPGQSDGTEGTAWELGDVPSASGNEGRDVPLVRMAWRLWHYSEGWMRNDKQAGTMEDPEYVNIQVVLFVERHACCRGLRTETERGH